MTETPDDAPLDARDNAESRAAEHDGSPGVSRATGASLPPEQLDARDAEGPAGTAAGDPLAGVLISEEDAAEAVPGDTGPEHPGARNSGTLDRPV